MASSLRILRSVLAVSLAASGMASGQTAAAEPEVPATPDAATKRTATEEIVVTGTRVRRKDLNTPAPLTVLSRDQISASGRVSLGEFLQALPEQGNSGANAQVNNTGEGGAIYVSLRSIGPQRTLVLINGRRLVPGGVGADPAPDLASIPAAAVDRIEVLKDGASAIYGSDAIAGVVNVILRKRFNGTEVGGYAGVSGHNDSATYDAHAVTGTAGDKGSMLFSVGYQEQRPVFAGNREFSQTTYNYDFTQSCFADPNSGNCVARALSGSGNSSTWPHGRLSIPASACGSTAVATHSALASVCAQSNNKGGGFMQDPTKPLAEAYLPYDGTLYNTNPTNYLITPSRRVQLFSTGDVNLGTEARAFFEASYVNRSSSQSLAPMPLVNSTIPAAPVTISKDSVYNPFGIDIKSWRKRTVEFGERSFRQDLDTFRVVAGLDGSLGEWSGPFSGWTWDLDYNHGRTSGTQLETGQIRMPNVANAVGPSMMISGTPRCLRVPGDPTTVIAGCVPMDVLHGVGALGQAAKSYVSYDGTDWGTNQQDIFSANFSGELFKVWAEQPAGLAIGADYRRESASFQNNPINGNSESSGNNAGSTYGGYNVKEAYAELVIPLLSGIPFVEDLEFQAAVRYNDFSTFGTNSTYKLGARWSPIRDLIARATYGTAFRAPNVAELFGGAADSYPRVTDPCNNPSDPVVAARCKSGPGVVPGGNSFDTSVQFLSKTVANANLGPETATTLTAGVVLQPQMIKNFSVTVDYYNLNVAKTITQRGASFILDQCYRAAVQDGSMCNLIVRNDVGQIILINDERANLGNYHTTGIDFAVRYALPTVDFGRFSLIVDGAYLNSFRITDSLGVVTNCMGNYDCVNQLVGGVLPRLKLNSGIFWNLGPIGAGVSGRYVGSYKECGSGICSQDDTQQRVVGHYLPIDVFASYTVRKWAAGTTALVLGVQNVGDTQPPFLANAFAANADPSTYDYVGRFFYSRLTHSF